MYARSIEECPFIFESTRTILDYYKTCPYFIPASEYPEDIMPHDSLYSIERGCVVIIAGLTLLPVARIMEAK
jgi:hypothetical protein